MQIYVVNIQYYLSEPVSLQRYLSIIPRTEQERILRFHFDKDKWLSLMGLLMMKQTGGIGLKGLQRTELGKPFLPDSDFEFSISHSGSYVVCAVEEKSILKGLGIGIDLEEIRPIDHESFHLVFTGEEIKRTTSELEFYQLWTQKEAIIKALGTGFSLDPKELNIDQETNSCVYNEVPWFLTPVSDFDGYATHICTPFQQPETLEVKVFRPEEL